MQSESTFSRFFDKLTEAGFNDRVLPELVEKIKPHRDFLGTFTAIDSTDLPAYASPKRHTIGDPDAKWGHRTAMSGSPSKSSEAFFGYKCHAIVDALSGRPLTYSILPANAHDSP